MKLAMGFRIQEGPWGGGNQFARVLRDALIARKDQVVFGLDESDIDIALLTDPRGWAPTNAFGPASLARYLLMKNPNAIVVHRVNECDERKGTRTVNRLLRRANYLADHTVFVASWLTDLAVWERDRPHSVILSGADPVIFDSSRSTDWDGTGPIRIVTHHWGGNRLKGFDCYEALDQMLDDPHWRERFSFTYIGRLPESVDLRNARKVPALSGDDLGRAIAEHHVYLTGSLNEPSGMHHIEGAMCGLPLIYRRSGGLPEYCDGFGLPFSSPDELPERIMTMRREYTAFRARMPTYPHTAKRMVDDFLALFDDLLARRKEILAARRLFRRPLALLATQLPR
ncbi:MAG: glycosyltransferase family 4 protein [Candidatus Competibacteraceae bacterium]|nr:glycosyltransferase family 4 protein [Candidatus Competibacteraceae bacterium]